MIFQQKKHKKLWNFLKLKQRKKILKKLLIIIHNKWEEDEKKNKV